MGSENRLSRHAKNSTVQSFALHLAKAYSKKVDRGIFLPEGCGGFSRPNYLHVRATDGFVFQFIVNRSSVRAQIFMQRKASSAYDGFLRKLEPSVSSGLHDFGQGVTGNGLKGGKTRALNLHAEKRGGWGSINAEWPKICRSAVEAMGQLFGFFEAHLRVI